MKRIITLAVVLAVTALLILGCSSNKNQATGYAAYGQQGNQQQYVGGGCGVAPVSDSGDVPEQVSDSGLAA